MAGDLEFPDSVKSSMPVEEILSPMSKEVIVLMPEDHAVVSSKALQKTGDPLQGELIDSRPDSNSSKSQQIQNMTYEVAMHTRQTARFYQFISMKIGGTCVGIQ